MNPRRKRRMMKSSTPYVFVSVSALDMEPLRHVMPGDFHVQDSIDETGEFRILDTFDRPLERSGRVLVRFQKSMLLFTPLSPCFLTQACPSGWKFLSDLNDGQVKKALSDVSPLRAFLEIGRGQMQAGRIVWLDDENTTHACAHLYLFERENRRLTIGVTQPLQEYAKSHRLLVEALTEQGAQGKATQQNLYALLGFENQWYCAKPTIALQPEDAASEAARLIIRTYLDVARQNEPGIVADHDTEFLHDYRVSLRKVRSVVSLFKGVYAEEDTIRLKQDFGSIMKQTNRLRDLDVYLMEKDDFFSMLPDSLHEGLRVMFTIFAQERAQELTRVTELLRSESYRQAINALSEQFRVPGSLLPGRKSSERTLSFASRLLWKRYKTVCRIGSGITAETPDDEVHRLRIHCKKLRYLMEFFTPLFAQKTFKPLIKTLKRLQDNLGRFNDFSVQQNSLQQFLLEHSTQHRSDVPLAQSIGALITVLNQRQLAERRKVMDNIAAFDSHETRQTFRTLFAQKDAS